MLRVRADCAARGTRSQPGLDVENGIETLSTPRPSSDTEPPPACCETNAVGGYWMALLDRDSRHIGAAEKLADRRLCGCRYCGIAHAGDNATSATMGDTRDDLRMTGVVAANAHKWWIPTPDDVCIRGEQLVWSWSDRPGGEPRYVVPTGTEPVLSDFCALAEGSAEEILRFVHMWGVLYICEHDLPMWHDWSSLLETQDLRPPTFRHCGQRRLDAKRELFWEPIGTWRRLAHEASTLLLLSAAERSGQPCDEEWRSLFGTDGRPSDDRLRTELLTQRLNGWIANAGPKLTMSGVTPQIRIEGVFGYLALLLSACSSSSRGWSICAECGRGFVPRRLPRIGERSYCSVHGSRAKNRNASQRYRTRQRGTAESSSRS